MQKPTWQEQYDLGVRYLSEGNYQEAIIAFTTAIEIDPKQAPAYVGRGGSYIGSGTTMENLNLAQTDYEKAIELDETLVDAYLKLAEIYADKNDYDKVLKLLQCGLVKTSSDLEAVPIGDGMQIGKKNFCLARKKLAGILTDFKSF